MKSFILIASLQLIAAVIFAQSTEFPKLTGPYLVQKPLGLVPDVIA